MTETAKVKKVFAWRTHFVFFLSIAITVLIYTVPPEQNWAYPFLLLSTLAHEMGHGLAALLVGAQFEALVLHGDASGWAQWTGTVNEYERAFIAAGGLIGPALLAAVCFTFGRKPKGARHVLLLLSILLFAAEVLVVKERFGLAIVGGLAICFLLTAIKGSPNFGQMVLIFLAVQLGLSIFSRSDYLFTRSVMTPTGLADSDVEYMSRSLGLPYWFWGIICATFSVIVMLLGLRMLLRHNLKKVE